MTSITVSSQSGNGQVVITWVVPAALSVSGAIGYQY